MEPSHPFTQRPLYSFNFCICFGVDFFFCEILVCYLPIITYLLTYLLDTNKQLASFETEEIMGFAQWDSLPAKLKVGTIRHLGIEDIINFIPIDPTLFTLVILGSERSTYFDSEERIHNRIQELEDLFNAPTVANGVNAPGFDTIFLFEVHESSQICARHTEIEKFFRENYTYVVDHGMMASQQFRGTQDYYRAELRDAQKPLSLDDGIYLEESFFTFGDFEPVGESSVDEYFQSLEGFRFEGLKTLNMELRPEIKGLFDSQRVMFPNLEELKLSTRFVNRDDVRILSLGDINIPSLKFLDYDTENSIYCFENLRLPNLTDLRIAFRTAHYVDAVEIQLIDTPKLQSLHITWSPNIRPDNSENLAFNIHQFRCPSLQALCVDFEYTDTEPSIVFDDFVLDFLIRNPQVIHFHCTKIDYSDNNLPPFHGYQKLDNIQIETMKLTIGHIGTDYTVDQLESTPDIEANNKITLSHLKKLIINTENITQSRSNQHLMKYFNLPSLDTIILYGDHQTDDYSILENAYLISTTFPNLKKLHLFDWPTCIRLDDSIGSERFPLKFDVLSELVLFNRDDGGRRRFGYPSDFEYPQLLDFTNHFKLPNLQKLKVFLSDFPEESEGTKWTVKLDKQNKVEVVEFWFSAVDFEDDVDYEFTINRVDFPCLETIKIVLSKYTHGISEEFIQKTLHLVGFEDTTIGVHLVME